MANRSQCDRIARCGSTARFPSRHCHLHHAITDFHDQRLIQFLHEPLQIAIIFQYDEVVAMVKQSDVFVRLPGQTMIELSNIEFQVRQHVHDYHYEVRCRVNCAVHALEQESTPTWYRPSRTLVSWTVSGSALCCSE